MPKLFEYFNTTSVFIKRIVPLTTNIPNNHFNTTSVFIKLSIPIAPQEKVGYFNTTSVFIKLKCIPNAINEMTPFQYNFCFY